MQVRRGRLDADLEIWVDAEFVREPASLQIAVTSPEGESVFVVRTPQADEIALVSRTRVPQLDATGLPDVADDAARVDDLFDEEPAPPGVLARLLSGIAWLIAAVATALVIALATGLLDAQVIQSPSMRPGINPGDLYVGVSSRLRAPQVGDVAAFNTRTLDGTEVAVFVHRIIGVTNTPTPGYLTKGDANSEAEALPTAPDDLRSTEIFTTPFGGLIVSLRPVMIALLGGLVMLLILRIRER